MTRSEVYALALKTYGADKQTVVAIEELSELAKELCKALRGKVRMEALIEEIADAEIMIEQIQQIYKIRPEVLKIKQAKIDRLEAEIGRSDEECR